MLHNHVYQLTKLLLQNVLLKILKMELNVYDKLLQYLLYNKLEQRMPTLFDQMFNLMINIKNIISINQDQEQLLVF